MVHSGYEASSVVDSVRKPWKPLIHAITGIKTEGEMAPEISLDKQRPAEFVFSRNVAQKLSEIKASGVDTKREARNRTAA